ncbi:MAG: DUF4981 domain-containing protein [Parabacteroides johnsonii]
MQNKVGRGVEPESFLDASHYQTRWFLEADGDVIEEGIIDLQVAPLTKKQVRIPYHKPMIIPGKEYRITIIYF